MDGVAHTTGIPLDDLHKEIHLSLSYITHVSSSTSQSSENAADALAKLTHELTGVLVHETVHTVQNNGFGSAPGGLIEGIADFVRLRAGLGAEHWRRPGRRNEVEGGYTWDAGYERTAFFLDWLDNREGDGGQTVDASKGEAEAEAGKVGSGKGNGAVVRMNEWLRENRYEGGENGDGGFWTQVCGTDVQGLWEEYLEWVEDEGEMAEAIRLSLLAEE